jgi:hypothetical protein
MRGVRAVILFSAVTLALGACSSVSHLLDSSSDKPAASSSSGSSSSSSGLLSGIGLGSSSSSAETTAADDPNKLSPEDYPCPDVTVRNGAGTLLIGSKSQAGEVTAMDLRYQGTLTQFARDCMPRNGIMTMKVGIQGRVISGPAGGPGQVDVPLRLAVVQEGPNPKTVLSKLVHIPVTVNADSANVDFTHVDPDIAFPIPKPISALDSYVVYVGFDPSASTPQKPKPRSRKR